jgi:O-antigen ligase
MGAFLVYYGAALFAFSLKAKSWGTRGACLAGFLVAVRGLLFTFSRGAYLALGSACGLLLLLANPAAFVVAGAVAVGAKYAPEIIPSSIQARLADTGETNQIYDDRLEAKLDRSSQHRLMLWRAGMAMVADHPLQGVGWHRFSETVGQYTEVQLAKDDPDDAHNAYILVGAELGIPALALMIVVLAWIIATSLLLYFRKTEPLDRALALSVLGSAVGVVVSCLFGSRFADETLISNFWTLVALLMASRHMRSDGSLFGAQP